MRIQDSVESPTPVSCMRLPPEANPEEGNTPCRMVAAHTEQHNHTKLARRTIYQGTSGKTYAQTRLWMWRCSPHLIQSCRPEVEGSHAWDTRRESRNGTLSGLETQLNNQIMSQLSWDALSVAIALTIGDGECNVIVGMAQTATFATAPRVQHSIICRKGSKHETSGKTHSMHAGKPHL